MNRSTLYDREMLLGYDVSEAINRCANGKEAPLALRISTIAQELAHMKFTDPKTGQACAIPQDVLEHYSQRYLSQLDASADSAVLSIGYELYGEAHQRLVVPVSEEFFGALNGNEILHCLDALTDNEVMMALPRRNNPTTGIVIFPHAQSVTKLAIAWYQRHGESWDGQLNKIRKLRERLPALPWVSPSTPRLGQDD